MKAAELTPVQAAFAWHCAHPDGRTFLERIAQAMQTGLVYAGPDAFLLAQEVLCDPETPACYSGAGDRANCWFIELAAGPRAVGRFFQLLHRPQPWVAYHRNHRDARLRVWPWARLKGIYGRNVQHRG